MKTSDMMWPILVRLTFALSGRWRAKRDGTPTAKLLVAPLERGVRRLFHALNDRHPETRLPMATSSVATMNPRLSKVASMARLSKRNFLVAYTAFP